MYQVHQVLPSPSFSQLGDVDEFRLILRMPPDVYQWLLDEIRPDITPKKTNYRKFVSAEERLALTMRHLALGKNTEIGCFFLDEIGGPRKEKT